MTKEELKQEAEKSLDKRLGTYAYIRKQDCYTNYVDGYIDGAEPREKRIEELEEKLANADYQLEGRDNEIRELKALNEKMKKYGKLLQDICVVLGNDNFMVAVQLESVVKKLWDVSEEKEGLKMVEDIEKRLLEIKPQEWAEITKWEIKEK